MKQLLIFSLLFMLENSVDAQNKYQKASNIPPLTIDTLYTAANAKEDLINFTISNPGVTGRELFFEILAVESENSYWGTIYSAYINDDSYFFKQWREGKKMAEKMNVKFSLPRYNKWFQHIDEDEAKDFSFKIAGKPMPKGMPVQLRVTATDNNETVYSPVFYLYKQPY